jgi:hypothetical protein
MSFERDENFVKLARPRAENSELIKAIQNKIPGWGFVKLARLNLLVSQFK